MKMAECTNIRQSGFPSARSTIAGSSMANAITRPKRAQMLLTVRKMGEIPDWLGLVSIGAFIT
ncbi:hypothetical protein PPNSA23_24950 [Phyllobacterium phragmitis]|uniref:Uncharacterized protein n=1 Tax=Phyllobacterium phragmitis TaxID=2670329 RepID=A0ABQ0H0U8_9HYPH